MVVTDPAQPHNFTVTAQTTQSVNFFWNLEGYADEFHLYVNDAETDVHTGHCAKDDSIVIGRVACNLGGLPTPGMEYNVSVRLCRAQLCVASEYLPVRTGMLNGSRRYHCTVYYLLPGYLRSTEMKLC